jgi:hypothetical protein
VGVAGSAPAPHHDHVLTSVKIVTIHPNWVIPKRRETRA